MASSWVGLVQLHSGWYPLMELRDVYKLFYQGVMGPEHSIASPEEFSIRFSQEYDSLTPDPTGRLIEPIRPDRSLLRLNLRPLKNRPIQHDRLIPALLETGNVVVGNSDCLRAVWSDFIESCHQGIITNFSPEDISLFSKMIKANGYPAVHHSDLYHGTYQPAYRIIGAEFLSRAGLPDAY